VYINPGQQFARCDDLLTTIEEYPFGTLVASQEGLIATHMPFVLDRSVGRHGGLLCHTPRDDPIWKLFDGKTEMLVIFMGPYAYISPSWYVHEAKVPTYNFKVVHAYGRPEIMEHETDAMQMLRRLVDEHERSSGSDWSFDKISVAAIAALRPGIVPFRMGIDRLEGKIRIGQHRCVADRSSVISHLRERGRGYDSRVADMMETGPVDPDAPKPLLANMPQDIIGGRDPKSPLGNEHKR
jgi:transcriptional regulator